MSDANDFPATLDLVRRRLRRARVGVVLGALLGVLAGASLLAIPDSGELTVAAVVLYVIAGGLLGAAIGSVVGGGRLQRVVTTVVGLDVASERIKNAVRGTELNLPETERPRAIRYATISSMVLPAQMRTCALITAALLTGVVARLIGSLQLDTNETPILTAVVGLIPSVMFAVGVAQRGRARRQAAAYLAEPDRAERDESTSS